MCEPFALGLLRRHLGGASLEQLASETGISEDRVEARIRGAVMYLLSRGLDRNLPIPFHRLQPFQVDWDLVWFE
jgi:hypothetical protein